MASQKGSIAVAVCALLLVALVAGFWFVARSTSEPEKAFDPKAVFLDYRDRAEQALGRQEAVDFSLEKNPNSFSCLYTSAAECSSGGGLFQLYESAHAGSQPLTQLSSDSGLDHLGMGCKGFPSEACPIRVEAKWAPVCGGARCEGTRSIKVKVRVAYQPPGAENELWEQEREFSPAIKLSQAVECERSGGIWTGSYCGTSETERQIASGQMAIASGGVPPMDHALPPSDAVCSNQLEIQGVWHDLEHLGPGRAQARVAAMNGCPGEDVFVFQCQPKPNDDREGQWVQVEAMMVPACNEPYSRQ